MADETGAGTGAADGQGARPADNIQVEAKEASQIETAATLNAAREAEEAKAAQPQADPAAQAAPVDPEPGVKRLPEWAEKKISEEAFQRREEARRRKAAEDKAAELESRLARLEQPPGQAQPQPETNVQALVSADDWNRAVSQEAERRAATAKFNEDCNRLHAEGMTQYKGEFDAALKNLAALGAMTPEVLQPIIATGDGARLLYELGKDPDEAAKVLSLPPIQLAIELGKRAAPKPAPRQAAPVSNAPAPLRPLEGSARVTNEPRDEDDDASWFKKREAQMREQRRA